MGKIHPMGVSVGEKGIQFVFVSRSEECGVILYDAAGSEKECIPFPKHCRVGDVHTMCVSGVEETEFTYAFFEGDRLVWDPFAGKFVGNEEYGCLEGVEGKRACFAPAEYDWEGDLSPAVPYEEAFVYCMHVRGFTRHESSGVKHRGTFQGVAEKIPYLKQLGVTTLELQPIYEFDEVSREQGRNYWGYTRGYYYAPKNSYAVGDSRRACKDMIKALHQNGMEAVLQFYFPEDMGQWEILDILRFWVTEYHVDGFHIKGQCAPMELILGDPCLKGVKLWYYDYDQRLLRAEGNGQKRVGIYEDTFCRTMRRFLKGEEGMVGPVAEQLRSQPAQAGKINYVTNYEGFTLMDMVSYERKHNEDNGEGNRDGFDYNFTWNCGVEGPSRKKSVVSLRTKQMKNVLSLLFYAQGTPLIFMGDEFGNSQGGNNNPYCQDNEITWLDWRDLERNRELFGFVRVLAEFRKNYPGLGRSGKVPMPDDLACGYPDLSYHGGEPWQADMTPFSRQLGIMVCGREEFFYLALNMHWEAYTFSLPRLPGGQLWSMWNVTDPECELSSGEKGQQICLKPRSICLLCSREEDSE